MMALIGIQKRFGSTRASASSVASGARVSTQPRRLQMRCTWVSTQMAGMPNDRPSTRLAVLRPTPGRRNSAASESGTAHPWSRTRISATARSWRALVL